MSQEGMLCDVRKVCVMSETYVVGDVRGRGMV